MPHHSPVSIWHPVVLLALALLACSANLARAQDRERLQRTACAGYDVVPSGFRRPDEPTRLSIQKSGRLLVSITDWRIVSADCDDITADGIQELVVRTFSGGAHCCETLRVYALADTPRLLLSYEANNAGGVEVRDINGDGRRELILGDDSLAYFDDLCYACSPSHLPLIACYTGTRFEDCTRQFPDLLRARREAYLARVGPATEADAVAQVKGAALGALAVSALLGEEEQGLAAVKAAGASDTVMAWVTKALPQVREWASTRGRKLKDGKG
ncbi:MAG: hypothetical protein ACM3NQ_23560 [Bacteroidales bacterium]